MSDHYKAPAEILEKEIVIKKSRFIARVGRVANKAEVKLFLEQARRDFKDARHHCWAYLIGNPTGIPSAATNDDGEPSGTAGRPILNVIQHKAVGDVMLVVIRYFGGVKLGAGGLTRAYSSAAENVLSTVQLMQIQSMTEIKFVMNFSVEQIIRHWLENHSSKVINIEYTENVTMTASVPSKDLELFLKICSAQSIILIYPDCE